LHACKGGRKFDKIISSNKNNTHKPATFTYYSMSKSVSLFITYNPGNQAEQQLANRLHTIAAVNGFNAFLPDRFYDELGVSDSTRQRIQMADYVILFSFGPLSKVVKEEIQLAYQKTMDPSRILVIYDKSRGKNLTGKITDQFTRIDYDRNSFDPAALQNQVFKAIQNHQFIETINRVPKQTKKEDEMANALGALLGIGLGLVVLGAIFGKK
jgi:hypothetical protein